MIYSNFLAKSSMDLSFLLHYESHFYFTSEWFQYFFKNKEESDIILITKKRSLKERERN